MEFSIKRGAPRRQKTACVIAGVHAGKILSDSALDLDKASRGALQRIVQRGDVTGKAGEYVLLPDVRGIEAERVLLIGIGKRNGVKPSEYRQLLGKAAGALTRYKLRNAISTLAQVKVTDYDLQWKFDQQVLVFSAAAYRFDEHKSKTAAPRPTRLGLLVEDNEVAEARRALKISRAKASGVSFMKDLANRPGNVCTPTHLAEQATALAERSESLKVTVLEEAAMEKLGMGALLSVAKGSRQPAKLITLEFSGNDDGSQPIVIVGKGVTFDSGGISIKPSGAMDEMKFDMSGAASVLGTMAAVAENRACGQCRRRDPRDRKPTRRKCD